MWQHAKQCQRLTVLASVRMVYANNGTAAYGAMMAASGLQSLLGERQLLHTTEA